MRLEFDSNGYVCTVVFGCETGKCTEYTGLIPTEPEVYDSYTDWADRAQVQAYKLDENGDLTYDALRAAALPKEDEIGKYSKEYCAALGIAPEDHTHSIEDFDLSGITTENISDIECNQAGKLVIGKTVISGGAIAAADIGNTQSSHRDVNIVFSAGYRSAPILTVTPTNNMNANAPYGIMTYIKEVTASGAVVRITSNYTIAALSVGLHWIAIGYID